MKPIPYYTSFLFPLAVLLWTSCPFAQPLSSRDAQVATQDTLPTLREQIYSQVRDGKTAEALALLEKTKPEDTQLLKAQFERVQQDFSRGLIGFDDFAITLARLHYATLEMVPGATAVEKAAIPRAQVRKLAEEGELEEALRLLLPAIELDATLLFARLHSTEKYYKQGLVTDAQLDRLKLSVKFAILELAE